MKVKVLRLFNDKLNGVFQRVGTTIDVTKERLEEILAVDPENPIVEIIEEDKHDSLLDSTVNEIQDIVTIELGLDKLQELLKDEIEGKNRKGVVEHIESLLKEADQ